MPQARFPVERLIPGATHDVSPATESSSEAPATESTSEASVPLQVDAGGEETMREGEGESAEESEEEDSAVEFAPVVVITCAACATTLSTRGMMVFL